MGSTVTTSVPWKGDSMYKFIGIFSFFLSLLSSVNVFAQAPSTRLEIVSFSRISDNAQNVSAEVCGIVHRERAIALGQSDLIRLILDKEGKTPRVYYTYAGQTGIFCSLVVTLEGTVEAAIEGDANLKATKRIQLSEGSEK